MSKETFDPQLLGGSIKRNIVNPDLIEERAKLAFDQKELELFMFGKGMIDEVQDMANFMDKHPEAGDDFSYYEMTREQKMEHWWKRFSIVMNDEEYHRLFTKHSERDGYNFNWHYLYQGVSPLHLHQSMFTKTLKFFGSETQQKKWLAQADHLQITGCYAQTELGHGSNVQGLETTAKLDLENDQFIIHTPSIRATKFWPGALGVVCTHAIVFARCQVDDSDYGVLPFLVPIRDKSTHMPYPGVQVGDVGEKLGYSSVDNGFLSFDNYRIPRKNMLSRFMSITKTGDFKMKENPKVIYQIMVQTRLMITFGAALNLLRSGVIATRYAACRRQFANISKSTQERKLLDYQTHMDILASNISKGFVLQMTARQITEKIVAESNRLIMEDNFKMLDVLHHFTSGLKALAAEFAYYGVDEMRQSCGGAGFLQSSGICNMWEDVAPYNTYEGVNVVMYQQSSRYLFKQAAKVAKNKKCTDYFEYINGINDLGSIRSDAKTVEEFLTWDNIEKTLAIRSLYLISYTHKLHTESKESSKTKTNELFAMEVQKMVKTHLTYILFKMSKERIDEYQFKDQRTKIPLELMLKIFALKEITKDSVSLFDSGFFRPGSTRLVEASYKSLLVQMRPHMIPFIEFSPNFNKSLVTTIGNYHGDIYETQLEVAQNSRLNKTQVPPYFEKYIKPVTTRRAPKL